MSGIRDRLIAGGASALFGQVVTAIAQIGVVPLLLSYWKIELYGEWLILSTALGAFAVGDFGLGSAASNEMIMCAARGDKSGAIETYQSGSILIFLISIIAIALIATVLAIVPFEQFINVRQISHSQSVLVVMSLTAYVAVGFHGKLLGAGFSAERRNPEGMFYGHCLRLFEFAAVVVIVAFGGRPVAVAATFLFTRVLGLILIRWRLLTVAPWLPLGFGGVKFARLKPLALPSIGFLGFPLGNSLSQEGLVIVIGTILGPAAVVLFSTIRTLSRVGILVLNVINVTTGPEFSYAYGAGDLATMRKLHRAACRISYWAGIGTAILLLAAGPLVYTLWTRGKLSIDYGVFTLLVVDVVANTLWSASSLVPAVTNRHARIALAYLIGAVATIALAVPLTTIAGLTGTALSLFAIDAIMTIYTVHFALAIVHDRFRPFAADISVPPVGMMIGEMQRLWSRFFGRPLL